MEEGFYWMAVGLLALGLNQSLMNRHGGWLRGVERSSVAQLEQLSHLAWDRVRYGQSGYDHLRLASLDKLDQLDRVQDVQLAVAARRAEWAQHKAEVAAQVGAREAEWMSRRHLRSVVVCPEQNVRVDVPSVEVPEVRIPEVRVPAVVIPAMKMPAISVPAVHVTVDTDDDGTI
jgi:hypothetical protein